MVSLSTVVGHSRMQYEGTYPLLDIGVVQAGEGVARSQKVEG